ncbi:MAG TPA: 3-deoxy-manno-octulosonate cytidylyltransferase [Verrucomicrobia bacterium]|nr:3-deoxy-manno-octulosonate cytidylyltransferase [Verrucomicrobiota bacterium]
MNVIGVIPARWASTRLPGKSLVPLCGKPMIQRVVERAKAAHSLSSVLVATDDARIAEVVRGFGGDVVLTRPDHPSGTDRIAEAVAGVHADLVVNIQGDEPLLDPVLIDRLVEAMLADASWDMGTAAAPVQNNEDLESSSVVKVVWGAQHQALYFSRSVIPFVRDAQDKGMKGLYWRHLGLYAYRTAFLQTLVATPPCALELAEKLEQLRALYLGARMVVIETSDTGIGVDTPADVDRVEKRIRECEQHG